MRIRRRDRESSRSSEFAPFDQDTARASEPQGPTSLDPVKSLISEPPSIPPQDDQGLSGTLDERTPTDEVPVVDTPPPREAEAAVVDTPPQPAETAPTDTPPPASEEPAETAPTDTPPPASEAPSETAPTDTPPPASEGPSETAPTDTPPPASEAPSAASETAVAADPVPAAAGPQAGTVPEREPAKDVSEPLAAKEPVMRTPSISHDATELLNGSKPATRELPRVIAIANQKGGVGKTTTTVNLGAALAEQGYRVLVVDLDPQGNATTGLGVEARNFELSMYDVIMRDQPLEDCIEPTSVKNLFVAPATIDLAGVEIELVPAFSRELKLKRAIDTVVDDFDFVLIDCPPSLGLITVNGLAAADEVLVPIQCEYYALEGLSQLLRNVNLVSTNLNETLEVTTIVLTMYDARTRLSVDVANEVREHFSDRVCRVVIPRTVRLSEAPSFGQPITVFDPASRGAVAYRELAKEVSNGAPQRAR
jgi:chromosome partitioning protein